MGNIFDFQLDQITTAQFAINCEIENRKVTNTICNLQADANRLHFLQLQRWYLPNQFAFIPGYVFFRRVGEKVHGGSSISW